MYNSCVNMFKDNWLLGIGVGNKNFREIYGLYMKTRVHHFCVAAGTDAGYRGTEPLDKICVPAASVQSDLPRRRTGDHAVVTGPEDGGGTLEPAGRRTLRPSLGHGDIPEFD